MNIVILHCHFERGGVTQVVENHVAALRDRDEIDRIVLLCSDRCDGLSARTRDAVTVRSIDDFDYDGQTFDAETTRGRGRQITQQIRRTLAQLQVGQDDTVLHWHNHSLGKNTSAPAVIRQLAESGWRLLLQIHDFAEDNRPENYCRLISASAAGGKAELDSYLYPVAPHIHYAALTRADADALNTIGTGKERTHWLPNSVQAPPTDDVDPENALARVRAACGLPADARWCLYPVRGIRRKNVGEFLLLSRWTVSNVYAGLTLRPTTPIEAQSYERWWQLAGQVAPRARFDAAHHDGISYADNLAAADFVVSTSVAEGFGLTFLEPWLASRPVIARRLPTVTDDFAASGLQFDSLYDAIPIPGDQQWLRTRYQRFDQAWLDSWAEVPPLLRPEQQTEGGNTEPIDFASLTPTDQAEVLRSLAVDRGFESATMELSQHLVEQLRTDHDPRASVANEKIIANFYNTQSAANKLETIYRKLCQTAATGQIGSPAGAGKGVDVINRVRPFFPCRTETFGGRA